MAQPLYPYESPISSGIPSRGVPRRSRGFLGDGRSRLESSSLEAVYHDSLGKRTHGSSSR